MNESYEDAGNVGKQRVFGGSDDNDYDHDNQLTVAAVIDPVSGMVLSRGGRRREDQSDETVVIAGADQAGVNGEKQMAAYIPGNGKCVAQDKTVIWTKKAPQSLVRVTGGLASYRSRLGKRGQLVVSVGFFILLLVGIVGTVCQAGKSDGDRGVLHPPAGNRAPSLSPPAPVSKSVVPAAPISTPVALPSSKIAADALVEGRLDEALNHYRALNAYYPQEKPYALIVDILAESQKGRLR
ncbi:MAG: hypothetical protein GY762_19930 [Proteobacteria bacterium]|nr:hypothetical protein [Pseudomonadota bacterium]